jgi:DNA-directed RNA polymerase III subunit RPC1
MPFRTLRFNECVCKPYNADFDGDEMNIHLPQTEEAQAEARNLMDVKQNLMIPRSGDPLVSATQDFLTSSYLITYKDRFLNRAEFMSVCAYFGDGEERIDLPPPAIIKPVELWTGKQVISVMLRPNRDSKVFVNTAVKEKFYSGVGKQMCTNDGWVIFQNSELICGALGKSTMGSESKTGLIYSLIRDNGVEIAAKCMQRVSKFSARWLSNYGMSIGIGDVTPAPLLIQKKKELIENGYKRCDELIAKYDRGIIDLKPGCNMDESLEAYLTGELSRLREQAGTILKDTLPSYNAPRIMAVCGAKGSDLNLSQMIACVG